MSYITERRQEERDRRRAEIVDAAEALYSEVGWDAVTMDQVARRARLGLPGLRARTAPLLRRLRTVRGTHRQ
jgi:AcrR family transcriptional regulator